MASEAAATDSKGQTDVGPETATDSAPVAADTTTVATGDAVESAGDATEGHRGDALAAKSSAPNGKSEAAAAATDSADAEESAPADDAADAKDASALKKTSNGKRKSGGVPEHKNKKANKRKSTNKITNLDAQPGELYTARLKSYPPWPAIICDEEMLPDTLINTRPVTTKKADGTYNEAYADGGKKAHERTFPVMFLGTNEFAWIHNTGLTELKPEDCKDVSEKGKNKSLIEAYKIAAEGHDLQHFKNVLIDHAKFIEEEEALKAEKEAEKAQKAAAKKKRKSEAKVPGDEADAKEADDADVAPKSAKKRKKAAETDDEELEKPAKTPKTTKLKLTTSKTPVTSEKKSMDKPAKAKTDKKSKAAATEDEEMPDAPAPEHEAPVDPEEARKAREREVLFLRHRLQKGFISRLHAPQEDDMPQMSNFIKKLENYQDLEVSIIRGTKINKVLKAIIKLNTIPRDEEFNFRKRSVELLGRWKILGADPHDADAADKESKDTPTTNGVNGEASIEEFKLEEAEEKPAADETPADADTATATATDETAATKDEPAAQPSAGDQAPESAPVESTEAVKTDA